MRLLLAALLTFGGPALAQDPVDVGVVRDADVLVVQKLLYPKSDRTELGASLGWMPWDPYTTTPHVQLSADVHLSERMAFSAVLGGGYGFKSPAYIRLERDHGVAVNAYRYLTSLLFGVQYSPVYGKVNVAGNRIVHHDVYGAVRGGVTLEKSVIPRGGLAVGPTVSLGLGSRVFLGGDLALRFELRDDVVLEYRKLTDSMNLKQNFGFMIGITRFSPVDDG